MTAERMSPLQNSLQGSRIRRWSSGPWDPMNAGALAVLETVGPRILADLCAVISIPILAPVAAPGLETEIGWRC